MGYLYRPYTANTVWGRLIYRCREGSNAITDSSRVGSTTGNLSLPAGNGRGERLRIELMNVAIGLTERSTTDDYRRTISAPLREIRQWGELTETRPQLT